MSTAANGTHAPVIGMYPLIWKTIQTLTLRETGTHNGHFHADEALAVHLLRLLPAYRNASLVRSRDPSTLNDCTVVVDVAAVHDHTKLRYDHHQREFNATFPGRNTKLSSAGLVWLHYGRDIIAEVTGLKGDDNELLYNKLYDDFVEAFDANDNGVSVYDSSALRKSGIEKKFSDKGYSIASVVNRFNYAPSPTSKANGTATDKSLGQEEEDARFLRASTFVGEQFDIELYDKAHNWLPARALVLQAFNDRTKYDAQGRILVIPQQADGGAPWADHMYTLEREQGIEGQILYVLFAEDGTAGSKWRIRAVSVSSDSFENRKGLPEAWRGVRDDELSRLSGIDGCIFVHAAGFIGGNKTFEGALKMAQRGVEE